LHIAKAGGGREAARIAPAALRTSAISPRMEPVSSARNTISTIADVGPPALTVTVLSMVTLSPTSSVSE